MMDPQQFDGLIDRIMALGFAESTAGYYASIIGDTPLVDDSGHVLVVDAHGNLLERLPESILGAPAEDSAEADGA